MGRTELRIGNLIYDYANRLITVTGIDSVFTTCKENHSKYLFDDIQPIPLTEEWLKRFGFEMDTHPNPFEYLEEWFIETDDPKSYTGKYCEFAITKEKRGFWYDHQHNSTEERKIKYIHQLQNLYFALTGKELEIK